MKRRDFFSTLGAVGLLVSASPRALALAPIKSAKLPKAPADFNAYLRVAPDGKVTCYVGKIEMGQGTTTGFAQMVADELDVRFDDVTVVAGDTDLCPWDMGTWGSLATWQTGPVLRSMAAEARAVLLQLAAERLGVPVEQLSVSEGVVRASGRPARQVGYGALVAGQRIERHVPDAKVKALAELKVVGASVPRKDAYAKVTGAAKYAADIILPGMLHAALLRPPYIDARLLAVDTSEAEKIPGVRIVRLPEVLSVIKPPVDMDHPGLALEEIGREIVAALHPQPDVAIAAAARFKAEWSPSPWKENEENIYEHFPKAVPPFKQSLKEGSIAEGEAATVKPLNAVYRTGYAAHATIETHSALAQWDGSRMTVYASTQAPWVARTQLAQALSLPETAVRVITPFVGGGFGGKSGVPQAVEAARLARAAGAPVQVAWSREEEFLLDTYRPAAEVRVRSGLDKSNRISFWDFDIYCAGDREAESFYEIPHLSVRAAGGWTTFPHGLHPFGIGPWRGPSATTNVFARESHIDALAVMAGEDPFEFRLKHVKDPRPAAVLRAVAKLFGYTPARGPSGRGIGFSSVDMHNAIVAAMAEVEVDRASGEVKVKRVAMAVDIGQVINPDMVRQQIEGSIVMALGSCFREEIHFDRGIIEDTNFDTYEIARFSWVPQIDSVIVDNPGVPAQGVGEPPLTVMGGLMANAIFDATGVRLYQLPFTPERIKAALAARKDGAVEQGRRETAPLA